MGGNYSAIVRAQQQGALFADVPVPHNQSWYDMNTVIQIDGSLKVFRNGIDVTPAIVQMPAAPVPATTTVVAVNWTALKKGDVLEGQDGAFRFLTATPYVSATMICVSVNIPPGQTLGGLVPPAPHDRTYEEILESCGVYGRYVEGTHVPCSLCPYFKALQEHPWFQNSLPAGSPYLLTPLQATPSVVAYINLAAVPSFGLEYINLDIDTSAKNTRACCTKSISENGHAKFHLGGLCYACATK